MCVKNTFISVGFTKTKAFAAKSGQNISSSVGVTKSRAFATKSGQNCTNLLCRNNISRASPENNAKSDGLFKLINQKFKSWARKLPCNDKKQIRQ